MLGLNREGDYMDYYVVKDEKSSSKVGGLNLSMITGAGASKKPSASSDGSSNFVAPPVRILDIY